MGIWPNFTGMIPGWSPIKVVQTVPVGCISRSRGQYIGFWNKTFKNLLVWHYKAQRFHILLLASSRGPLSKLFKLCHWGSVLLAPLWPLTFSSAEQPRALWALLFVEFAGLIPNYTATCGSLECLYYVFTKWSLSLFLAVDFVCLRGICKLTDEKANQHTSIMRKDLLSLESQCHR